MQQIDDFKEIEKNLQKGMLLSLVKIKMIEAKTLWKKSEIMLNKAIVEGNGQQIYDCAYENFKAKDRYKNLILLHNTVLKGV